MIKPLISSIPRRNMTFQLLMILLVSRHIKRYALVPSQYPKNTEGMDLDSNLFLFSLGMHTNVLHQKLSNEIHRVLHRSMLLVGSLNQEL